jgi:hypothetical protein
MTPIRTTLTLMLVLAVLLLAAGCESQSPQSAAPAGTTATQNPVTTPTRQVTTTIPPAITVSNEQEQVPVTTITRKPESLTQATVAQPGNYHPEYIKMDATTYSVGEVVQFYLVNKGPEITGCDYAHPAYTIYHLSPDGTRLEVSANDPNRSYITVISLSEPGSATGPFSLDTRKLSPGRYLIRFDCGNSVAREFVIMARS